MSHIKFLWILTVCALPFAFSSSASEVNAVVSKHSATDWMVIYSVPSPVQRIVFKRTPDDSRVRRWHPESEEFVVRHSEQQEYVERRDGESFSEVRLKLTPTYIPLPKEYAPFSPFSDGGMAIYTGRFFACAEQCTSEINEWALTLSAGQDDNIVVNGNLFRQQARWVDTDSGQMVYVGRSTPTADELFVSVVDKELPKILQDDIAIKLPLLVNYFAENLGELDFRPTLFASFSESTDGGYGHQGGTLPAQIFMHWYGRTSIEHLDSESTYWFFAHEVGHIFQREAGNIEPQADAWVHEGAAELFAGLASSEAYYSNKIMAAKQKCERDMAGNENYSVAAAQNPDLYYSCGLLIMHALNQDLKQTQKMDIFDLWRLFDQAVKNQGKASAQLFTTVASPYLSEAMKTVLIRFSEGNVRSLLAMD